MLEENLIAKESDIQNLNSKIHSQKEEMKLLKNVHLVDIKKKCCEKKEKLKEEFDKKICTKKTEIHNLHAKVKELETQNENSKLKILTNETQIQNLNSKIHLQKKTFEEKMKLLKNVHFVDLKKSYSEKEEKLKEEFEQKICTKQTEIHDLHAKVKELETPNENLKVEITILKSNNYSLKSTNDDLKFQLELLNEQIEFFKQRNQLFSRRKSKNLKNWN